MKEIVFALWLFFVLVASESQQEISQEKLKKLSKEGAKYIDEQIENAMNEATHIKLLMEKNDAEHQEYLQTLEAIKKRKEDALETAVQTQKKLNEAEQCKDKEALWEECKPCLKHVCTRFYAKTCRRGFGMVEKKVEQFFNQTPMISIWVNGDKMDSLVEKNEELSTQFDQIEKQYEDIDGIFRDTIGPFDGIDRWLDPSFPRRNGFFPKPFSFFPETSYFPSYRPSIFDGRDIFHSFFEATQKIFDRFRGMIHSPELHSDSFLETNEKYNFSTPTEPDQLVCREIRRNSSGCMKLSAECEKCKEVLTAECFDLDHKPLRKDFEEALSMAERFTKEYDSLLKEFELNVLNTSQQLEMLNKQFGWVSKLANMTQTPDGMFDIKTIMTRSRSSNDDPFEIPASSIVLRIFDSPPLSFTVPGDINWDDPKFSEIVAQRALDHYNDPKMVFPILEIPSDNMQFATEA
uniref:Clusterin n=1 Tax=Callorhinchus milii TaxID=7868 RepID=A0A4W3IZ35_CALMI|eukprot:gi/632951090/ref/XP_007891102.1/ PREDICTED: clusterin [Callorhinchus milii]